jgi:hypothetical protein
VGQHHALGLAGRARRELDECRLVARQARRRALARDIVQQVDEERAGLERRPRLGLALRRGEGGEPLAQLAVGVEERVAELPGDAQQLLLVLVTDAAATGTGTMPP